MTRLSSPVCGLPLALVLALASGCVTVYQPLTALQRPVVVVPELANFTGLHLFIHCVPVDFLDRKGAEILCRKLDTLFSNQGAEVTTSDELAIANDAEDEDSDDLSGQAQADLSVELKARLLHSERNTILWVLSYGTLTLFPAISEYTFAQDVSIRDRTGFLLATESMKARFVRYFGAGAWVSNWLLDKLVREDAEELTGNAAKKDFSKDFYGQLSQMVFNARMRQMVLHSEGSPAVGRRN